MMEGKYPIYLEDKPVGEARVQKAGLYVRFSCDCGKADGRILHLVMETGGGPVLLGVPIPMGNQLILERKLSARSLGEAQVEGMRLYDRWPVPKVEKVEEKGSPVEEEEPPVTENVAEVEEKEASVEQPQEQVDENTEIQPPKKPAVEDIPYTEGMPIPGLENWEHMRTVPQEDGSIHIRTE